MTQTRNRINWPFVRVFVLAVGSWMIAATALLSANHYDSSLGFPMPVLHYSEVNAWIFSGAGMVAIFTGMHWMNNYGPFFPFRYEERKGG